MNNVAEPIDLMDVVKAATYTLPVGVWLWLKQEAERRGTTASALIVELARNEAKKAIAA